jgi:hypothetical protein
MPCPRFENAFPGRLNDQSCGALAFCILQSEHQGKESGFSDEVFDQTGDKPTLSLKKLDFFALKMILRNNAFE